MTAARLLPLALALGVAVAAPSAPAAAAAPGIDATFGTPSGTSTFGRGLRFEQPVTITGSPRRVEALVTLPGSDGPLVVDESDQADSATLRYTLDTPDGGLLPNTVVSVRWRIVGNDESAALGPSVSVRYVDDRFDWRTETGDLVTIHWYQGDDGFGRRALGIAEDGVTEAEHLLGTTETKPIDFFVYADQQAFYDALGPGTRENVGGEAIPEIRTLFGLITPSELNADWVHVVIPHELTHLVFDTTVHNPYHEPPRWLNEGLAVYLSQGFVSSDRGRVRDAVRGATLMPLSALEAQFPTTSDQFFLGYAESVSAVDFLVRTYGKDALVGLVRSYAGGRSDDDAFTAALGVDVAAFQAAWLSDLGAPEPEQAGPRPAPGGPVPSDWGAPGPGGSAVPSGQAGTATAAPVPAPPDGGPAELGALVAGVLVIVAIVGLGLARRRSRARGREAPR
ncbi:MAG TPA: peptidase MA family metallohydrolase [Candidatus Limnocylindrales bacterium]